MLNSSFLISTIVKLKIVSNFNLPNILESTIFVVATISHKDQ